MTTETKANDVITGFNGLTKREYFAAMAMQGLCCDPAYDQDFDKDLIIGLACSLADALIDELDASK